MSQTTPPRPPQQPYPPGYQGGPIPAQVQINLAPIVNNWGIIRTIALWVLYLVNIACGIYCCIKYFSFDFVQFLGILNKAGNSYALLRRLPDIMEQLHSLGSFISISAFIIWLDIVIALLVYITRRSRI